MHEQLLALVTIFFETEVNRIFARWLGPWRNELSDFLQILQIIGALQLLYARRPDIFVSMTLLNSERIFLAFSKEITWVIETNADGTPRNPLNDVEICLRRFIIHELKITDINYLKQLHAVCKWFVHEIEVHPSPFTSAIKKAEKNSWEWIKERINVLPRLPSWAQNTLRRLHQDLTMSENELIIRAIQDGTCEPDHAIHFKGLTDKEAIYLLNTLDKTSLPHGLKITYDKNHLTDKKLIRELKIKLAKAVVWEYFTENYVALFFQENFGLQIRTRDNDTPKVSKAPDYENSIRRGLGN